MAKIVIEINDLVSDKIDAKINAIDTAAKNANQSVGLLNKSLKELDKSALGGIAQVIRDVTASQKALNATIREGEKTYGSLRNQTITASQSQELFNAQIKKQALSAKILEERLKQAEIRTERLGEASDRTSRSMFNLTNIFRVLALIKASEQAVQLVDAYTLMENRLKLVSRSTENLVGLQSELFRISNTARVPVVELTQSFVRYDYALRELGATQRESLRFTETLSKQLAIGGLATQEQSSALLQLSQALNKGKLDGDEFRTIMETLPTLATAIAREMGVARGELIKLAPEGKITSEVIRKAMASIADETDKAFSSLAPTIGQSLTVLKNNIIKTIGELNSITGFSETIANGILFLSENLKILSVGLIGVASAVTVYYIPSMIAATEKTALMLSTLALNPYALAIGGFTALASAVIIYKDEVKLAGQQNLTFGDSIKGIRDNLPTLGETIIELASISFPELKHRVEETDGFFTRFFSNIFNSQAYISGLQEILTDIALLFPILSDALHLTNGEFDRFVTSMENAAKAREDNIKKQQESIDLINKEKQAIKNSIDLNKLLSESYKLIDPKNKGQDTSREGVELAVKQSEDEYRTRIVLLEAYLFKDEKLRAQHAQLIYDLELESMQKSAELRNPEGFKEKLRLEQEEKNILNSIKREVEEYSTKQRVLNDLISKGAINQSQYNSELNKTSLMQLKLNILKDSEIKPDKKDFSQRIKEVEAEGQIKIKQANELANNLKLNEEERLQLTSAVAGKIISDILAIEEEKERAHQSDLDRIKEISEASTKQAEKASEDFDKNEKKRVLGILKDLEDKKKKKAQEAKDEKKANELAKELAIERVEIAANMFGSLAGLADKFAQGRGKDAERAFKLTKALAYAEAVANTAAGVARAIKDYSFPTSLAVGVSAAAAGATQIATIKNTEFQGYARGGVDIGGYGTTTSDAMLVRVSRGESYINAQSTRRHKSLLEAINDDNGTTSSINNTYVSGNQGGGNVIVNIHNNSGNEVRQESSVDSNGQKQIDVFIEQVETRLAQKYADGNGKLAKAIDGKRLRNY